MREKKSFLGIAIRGIAIGAADVVPGVSGGTIAFITGIYEELLETISNLNFRLLKTWKTAGFKAMWEKGNFSFLVALLTGIAFSIISLAVFIEFLLKQYPIQLWAFFFGLIIASVWLVGKSVKQWNAKNVVALIIGSTIGYFITTIPPTMGSESLLYIFICGAIAICAMILPGISGSFILLLLGAYTTVLGAVSKMVSAVKIGDWSTVSESSVLLGVFILGCIAGLTSFSKLLNVLFKKAYNITVAILTGFLIGSLNKIWPWKEIITSFVKHPGEVNEEIVPLVEKNISPNNYTALTGEPNFILYAVLLMLFGIALIIILDKVGQKNKTV